MSEVESPGKIAKQLFSIQLMLAGIGFVLIDYVRAGIVDLLGGVGVILLIVGLLWGAALIFID